MAVQCDTNLQALKRTTGVVAASSNYTCVFWYKAETPTSGTGRSLFLTVDSTATYLQWVAIWSINPDPADIYLSIGNAGVELMTTTPLPIQVGGWTAVAYTRSGTTHTLYVNGASAGALTQDVSAFTFGQTWIVGDGEATASVDSATQYFREWSSVLTLAQILAEHNSPTPVVTSTLVTNTPLVDNYDDTTANNHDWTPVGSPTFVLGPTPLALTNTSGALAHDLGDLSGPGWVQVVKTAIGGSTQTWYTFTTSAESSGVIAWFGFGMPTQYLPTTTLYPGPTAIDSIQGSTRNVYAPVDPSTAYWLRQSPGSPVRAAYWLRTQTWTQTVPPAGSILINDATGGWPAAILSDTTGAPVAYRQPFPGGERMTQLNDGTMLVESVTDGNVQIFNSLFVHQTGFVPTGTVLSSNRTTTFLVGAGGGGPDAGTVESFNASGVAGESWQVASSIAAMAPARDLTILYYAAGTSGAVIARWNLVTDLALSNLAAGVVGYVVREILVLADGNILALYRLSGSPFTTQVKRYSPAGATLNTYATQYADNVGSDAHIAINVGDTSDYFVTWFKVDDDLSRFSYIQTSDGTVTKSFTAPHFSRGISDPAISADPTMFGHSESCTFLILPLDAPEPPTPGVYATETVLLRRLRRAPVIHQGDSWIFHTHFQLDLKTGIGVDGASTVQGHDPQVMLRWSNNGGRTWSNEHWVSAGKIGQYTRRAMWRRLGRARNRVYEVVVSDPNAWQIVAAFLGVEEGTN